MKVQILKTHNQYFGKIVSGRKRFEYRFNDRNYQVGDPLILVDYTPDPAQNGKGFLTGDIFVTTVTYMLSAEDEQFAKVLNGNVILSLSEGVFIDRNQYKMIYYQEYENNFHLRLIAGLAKSAAIYKENCILNRANLNDSVNKPNLLVAINGETGEWALLSFKEWGNETEKLHHARITQVHHSYYNDDAYSGDVIAAALDK